MGQRTDTERREDGKAEDSRRRFIKTGVKGALLLPYAAPLVETIALPGSTAQAASPPPPPPPPEVYSCVPDNGEISTNISVTINGASFEATPTVDFGQGINITGVTFVDSTELTVDISIKSFAVPGYRDVTVTNPDTQSDTLVNGFTVAPAPDPPPTVTSCVPDNGLPNQSFVVSVYGSDFVATPTADFGSRIDILVVTFVSSTQIDVTIDIRHNATVGYRDVMITNPDTRS